MEHEVDRSGVQAQQCAQLADTNRPEAWSRREEGCPVGAEWLVFGFEGMAWQWVRAAQAEGKGWSSIAQW